MFTQPRQATIIEVVKRLNRNHGHDYDDENLTDRDREILEIDTNKDLETQLYEAIKPPILLDTVLQKPKTIPDH